MQLLSSDIESLAAMALADVADARLLMAVIETDTHVLRRLSTPIAQTHYIMSPRPLSFQVLAE